MADIDLHFFGGVRGDRSEMSAVVALLNEKKKNNIRTTSHRYGTIVNILELCHQL